MKRPLLILIVGTFALWAVLFFPARYWGGQEASVFALVACVVCLIPSGITLAWAMRVKNGGANQQMALVLGGTGLRMAFVLLSGLVLYLGFPYFQQSSFWVWLLIFYLATLALEVVLVRNREAAKEK